jgi:hypothetical protein
MVTNIAAPLSFEDVVAWLMEHVGRPLNVLLSSPGGDVLALVSGPLRDAEELQEPPAGPRRIAFVVGECDNYFVLDEDAFVQVESVGIASLLVRTATARLCVEVEAGRPVT